MTTVPESAETAIFLYYMDRINQVVQEQDAGSAGSLSTEPHGGLVLTCVCARYLLQIVKDKQEFERVEVSREEALSMFAENKFKSEIIQGLPSDATISLYRCGPMVIAPRPANPREQTPVNLVVVAL